MGEGQAGSCRGGSFPLGGAGGCGEVFPALKLSCCCESAAEGLGEQLRQAPAISRN